MRLARIHNALFFASTLLLLAAIAPCLGEEPTAVQSLRQWLKTPADQRGKLAEQDFAQVALSKAEARTCQTLLWQDHVAQLKKSNAKEMESKSIKHGDFEMKFDYKIFGKPKKGGRSLYISMHGGGGAPKQVNDQQWENQKRLYAPQEGVYLAPRAPTDSWNMWHQGYMDPLLDHLIADLIVFENVDPNRVYLMGYSAGGDGVYQLAPRMADRFAAAAMMAGHPNEASPLGLRNLPFALYCGGADSAYNRNKIAAQWGEKLDSLQSEDPHGYVHRVKIYPNKGHWMDREDAEAVPWMAEFKRNLTPEKVVWRQDDVTGNRFYWLATDQTQAQAGHLVTVERNGQVLDVTEVSTKMPLAIRLRDDMLDLDQPIKITQGQTTLFEGKVNRTITALAKTLLERGDPSGLFSAEVTLEVKPQP
jgi:pimeloyl-ACP methyl ester carboxylesterase